MTIECFQRFVEISCPSACVPVDLVKIARTVAMSNVGPRVDHEFRFKPPEFIPSPLCLVMDGECCLDRLYGGYFGDWVCGGQWNRMLRFLQTFFQVASNNNIEITVFFNGASEPHRLGHWIEKQKTGKEKMSQVLRHVSVKGTPPPKVWWVPPCGLRTVLRAVLRFLKVNVILTMHDHHQEVMSYLKKHNYHGLIADNSEYMIFYPPRYFSSVQLKLTFKGGLETKEYILNEVTRCLNLHPSRICIVAALLGNHILTDHDLSEFYHSLCPEGKGKVSSHVLIRHVVDYVRNLPSVDDLNEVACKIFGSSDGRCEKFTQCVLYYCRGNRNTGSCIPNLIGVDTSTKNTHTSSQNDGNELHYNHQSPNKPVKIPLLPTPGCLSDSNVANQYQENEQHTANTSFGANSSSESLQKKDDEPDFVSKFASEKDESDLNLQSVSQVMGNSKHGQLYHFVSQEDTSCDNTDNFVSSGNIDNHKDPANSCRVSSLDDDINSSMETMTLKSSNNNIQETKDSLTAPPLPKVSVEVMKMARERHQKGLMHPFIYQILSQGEIKIPVTFEDETSQDLPSPAFLYRPMRQMIYALLFNQHHLQYLAEQNKDEKVPEIVIKEWVWSKGNNYSKPDLVPCVSLGWPVPTITRLWFGAGLDDNKKRMQAFLTCMRSNSPLLRDPSFLPQHLILLCCVLRYMLTSSEMPFIYKHELDAFLVQAVDPNLLDTEHTQKLELPLVTSRGIRLAALFMQGVDHAILANDACGAPIPWVMCWPWLFFDGKLFHRKLLKANGAKNIVELCNNKSVEVELVEQLRSAVLEGVSVKFHPAPMHGLVSPLGNFPVPGPAFPHGRGRGHQRVVPRGGQLEVAGVVVGSWGPNYGQGPRSPIHSIPPQIVSVGGVGRGRGLCHLTGMNRPTGRSNVSQNCKTNSGGMKAEV